jgi:phospholipid/cholesterol/gamma-HCH transport system substrate-binding protein
MKRNIVESVLGAIVIVVALGFFVWAYARADVGDPGGYTLVAKFDRIDGIDPGGAVRISGIRVGQILATELDPATYRAQVRFSVDRAIELPADTSAQILSTSLLGGKYLALIPGGDDLLLDEGDEITFTQSSVSFEDLIGQFIFSQGSDQDGAQDSEQ